MEKSCRQFDSEALRSEGELVETEALVTEMPTPDLTVADQAAVYERGPLTVDETAQMLGSLARDGLIRV